MVPSRKYNQNWLPSMFNDFFDNDWMEKSNATAPAINVLENEHSYDLELAAPGMTKDDFKVSLDENGDLVINMEKKQENNDEKKHIGIFSGPASVLHKIFQKFRYKTILA